MLSHFPCHPKLLPLYSALEKATSYHLITGPPSLTKKVVEFVSPVVIDGTAFLGENVITPFFNSLCAVVCQARTDLTFTMDASAPASSQ